MPPLIVKSLSLRFKLWVTGIFEYTFDIEKVNDSTWHLTCQEITPVGVGDTLDLAFKDLCRQLEKHIQKEHGFRPNVCESQMLGAFGTVKLKRQLL